MPTTSPFINKRLVAGLVLAITEIYFRWDPGLLGVKSIGISPDSPGNMGCFGQPLRTVQPQAALTECINNGVFPTFLKTKVWDIDDPIARVSKTNSNSENSITGGF